MKIKGLLAAFVSQEDSLVQQSSNFTRVWIAPMQKRMQGSGQLFPRFLMHFHNAPAMRRWRTCSKQQQNPSLQFVKLQMMAVSISLYTNFGYTLCPFFCDVQFVNLLCN